MFFYPNYRISLRKLLSDSNFFHSLFVICHRANLKINPRNDLLKTIRVLQKEEEDLHPLIRESIPVRQLFVEILGWIRT